jgi:hypothetical protein
VFILSDNGSSVSKPSIELAIQNFNSHTPAIVDS